VRALAGRLAGLTDRRFQPIGNHGVVFHESVRRRLVRTWAQGRSHGPLSGVNPPQRRPAPHGRPCRVGPGSFTPSLSQIPDVILSHHPARAIARRLPPSAEIAGSSRFDPVGPRSTTMTHPLRSMGIAPLRRYYEAVRPSPAHRYFQPHGWSRLCFFPWHRRPGSHVPYRSLVELRAAYTPDAARSVSGHPPS
jgi:hypothetical protein